MLQMGSRHVRFCVCPGQVRQSAEFPLGSASCSAAGNRLAMAGPQSDSGHWETSIFAPARSSRTAHLLLCAQPCGTCSTAPAAGPASSGYTQSPADTSQQHLSSRAATLAHIRLTATRQAPPLTGMLRPAPHARPSHTWAAAPVCQSHDTSPLSSQQASPQADQSIVTWTISS